MPRPYQRQENDPEPTPEGALLEQARAAAHLSAKAAGARAGISGGYWRQVERGFQFVSGNRAAISASALTIARMAQAVNITAAQLEAAGRNDAAKLLESPETPVEPKLKTVTGFDEVENHVWNGPGSDAERKAMITAYRKVRYEQWQAKLSA